MRAAVRMPDSARALKEGACWRRDRPKSLVSHAQPPTVMPVDRTGSPFHELDLEDLWKGIGKTRVRQHVNPLRREYQVPSGPLQWAESFHDPLLPLVLDLGCGPGRFLMLLHKRRKEAEKCNYLGIEIREKLVERANEWTSRLGFKDHVHFVYSNATISLASLMSGYPGTVNSVFIQFPDPHFKKRHRKRRIFQPDLVKAICDLLPPGGRLFMQSDVEDVSCAMRNIFEMYAFQQFELSPQHSGLEEDVFFSQTKPEGGEVYQKADVSEVAAGTSDLDITEVVNRDGASSEEDEESGLGGSTEDYDNLKSQWAAGGWLKKNPIGVPTEREHYVLQQGLPVYRILLIRTAHA